MKKLFALILCVMMLASVMSTSAFAETDYDAMKWDAPADVIDDAKENLRNLYGTYAANETIFNTAKTVDGLVKGLIKDALADYEVSTLDGGNATPKSTLNDTLVDALRATIGGAVTDYMEDHENEYTDASTKAVDPVDYLNTYANALSNAVSSADGQAGLQAFALYAMNQSVKNSLLKDYSDLQTSMTNWGKFDKFTWVDDDAILLDFDDVVPTLTFDDDEGILSSTNDENVTSYANEALAD